MELPSVSEKFNAEKQVFPMRRTSPRTLRIIASILIGIFVLALPRKRHYLSVNSFRISMQFWQFVMDLLLNVLNVAKRSEGLWMIGVS